MKKNEWIRFCIAFQLQMILIHSTIPGSVNSLEDKDLISKKNYFSTFVPTSDYPKDKAMTVSKQCVEDSLLLVKALLNHKEWALSMFQASGRLPFDGMTNYRFTGAKETRYDVGLFDECISSVNPANNIKGQHCSVFIRAKPLDYSTDSTFVTPRVNVAMRQKNPLFLFSHKPIADVVVGLCLPSSCSAQDVRNSVANKIGRTTFELPDKQKNQSSLFSLVTATHDRFCHTESKIKEQLSLDGLSIAFAILMSFIIGLVLASTIYDVIWKRVPANSQDTPHIEALHCFSVTRNIRELLKDSGKGEIGCLNGIRALSSLVTVCSHLSVLSLAGVTNEGILRKGMASWHTFPFTNIMNYWMDCCFLIGGVCTSTTMLNALNRGCFNISSFYVHRFLRLTPLYFIILFFMSTFAGRLGSGPNWNYVQYISEDCRSNWWYHLLYVNNWFTACSTFCMSGTWYSAADMQLLILSPLFVYPLWRWPRTIGPRLILGGVLVGHCYYLIVYTKWNLPLFLILSRKSSTEQAAEYTKLHYVKTLNRLTPYLIGILLGWILHQTKKTQLLVKKSHLILSWIISGFIIFIVNYGLFPYADENTTPVINPVIELMFGLFQRTLWSANLAWIIFLCVHGYGGIVNRFLSSKPLALVSRLSYAIFLVNVNLTYGYTSHLRIPIYATPLNIFVLLISIMMLILATSVILVIVIEIPFRKLERIIFSSNSATPVVLKNRKKRRILCSSAATQSDLISLPLKRSKE